MTRKEIQKIISLKSEDEIVEYVKKRINNLEKESVERTVGQNYTDSFRDYISLKTHYKAAAKFDDEDCPDLIYDDIEPYIDLVKRLKKLDRCNNVILFTEMFYEINNYLSFDYELKNMGGFLRYLVYNGNRGKRVSIKELKKEGCAYCSERAGLAHNMFKFLGLDSEVVCGARGEDFHAYNLVYPKGYDNYPIFIYDPSFSLDFINNDEKVNLGFFKVLNQDEYNKLVSGVPLKLDFTVGKEEELCRGNYYLEGYSLENSAPTYVFGLENAARIKSSKKR